MHALVVTLLLASPLASSVESSVASSPVGNREGLALAADAVSPEAESVARNRLLGAGAAGAALGAVGLVLGGAAAQGIAEIVKLSDPANTSASKRFSTFAIPIGAIAGGVAGLALGTIGGWELGDDLAAKPSVTR